MSGPLLGILRELYRIYLNVYTYTHRIFLVGDEPTCSGVQLSSLAAEGLVREASLAGMKPFAVILC